MHISGIAPSGRSLLPRCRINAVNMSAHDIKRQINDRPNIVSTPIFVSNIIAFRIFVEVGDKRLYIGAATIMVFKARHECISARFVSSTQRKQSL